MAPHSTARRRDEVFMGGHIAAPGQPQHVRAAQPGGVLHGRWAWAPAGHCVGGLRTLPCAQTRTAAPDHGQERSRLAGQQ